MIILTINCIILYDWFYHWILGKSPLIVMDDVDVAEAAKIAHAACFENHGQCCW